MPQSVEGVTYAHKIEKHEATINWSEDSQTVINTIRAFNPDPVAFSYIDGLRARIWQAKPSSLDKTGQPGEIVAIDKSGLHVQTLNNVITLTAIQLPIGKGSILRGADIQNAKKGVFTVGKCFSA